MRFGRSFPTRPIFGRSVAVWFVPPSLVYRDRVKETTTTTGTGTIALAGAVMGYQSFSAVGSGNTCHYCIEDGINWEVGSGTYTTGSLTRTTVLASSNAGALVSFPAGSKNVFLTLPAVASSVYVGATAPAVPFERQLWWKSDEGTLKIYYNDGTSSQWVDAATGTVGPVGPTGPTGLTGPAGAAGAGDLTRLAQVVTTGSQATITFSAISGSYSSLKLILIARDTNSGDHFDLSLKVNSDATSGNYTATEITVGYGGGTIAEYSAAATANGVVIGAVPGTTLATSAGVAEVLLTGYASTIFHKPIMAHSLEYGSSPVFRNLTCAAVWKSTSAITQLDIRAGGTAFLNGSIATLYGMT